MKLLLNNYPLLSEITEVFRRERLQSATAQTMGLSPASDKQEGADLLRVRRPSHLYPNGCRVGAGKKSGEERRWLAVIHLRPLLIV